MLGPRLSARLAAIAALAALAVLPAGCGEKEEPDLSATTTTAPAERAVEVAGDWTGQLTQQGLPPFQVAVRIEPSGSGQVAYTGINCAGGWALGPIRGAEPPTFYFRETIRRGAGGNCKGTGSVEIIPAPDGTLFYAFTGGGVESTGILTRTDAAGLTPIFREAGVPPPS